MNKRKLRFGKCFACFCEYTRCKPAKNRISRKDKKQLKKFVQVVLPCMRSYWGDDISSCDLRTPFKFYKCRFHLISLIEKYKPQIDIIRSYDGNEIYLTDEGRLGWFWEDDSDYSCSSGVMEFCYNKEQAGNTWAYNEMHGLWGELYKGHKGSHLPAEITSDKQLLEFIKNNPIPEKWVDED